MIENMNPIEKSVEEILKECNWYTNEAANLILKLKFAGYSKYHRDATGKPTKISWFSFIWENLSQFEWKLDMGIWVILMQHGQHEQVLSHLEKFNDIDEILSLAMALCPRSFWTLVSHSDINVMSNMDLAIKLINLWYGSSVVENLPILHWVDYKKIFDILLEKTPLVLWEAICYDRIKNFKWIDWDYYDDRAIVYKLLEKHNSWVWKWIAEHLDKFEDLDKQDYNNIAKKMIEKWEWNLVVENICKFHGLEWDVADMLVENWFFGKMAHNKKYGRLWVNKKIFGWGFKWWYPSQKTAQQLLDRGDWGVVWKYLLKFHGLEIDKDFALKLVEKKWWDYIFIQDNVWYFSKLDKQVRKEILDLAFWKPGMLSWNSISFGYSFSNLVRKFDDGEIYEILNKAVEVGNSKIVAKVLNFVSLDFDKDFLFKLVSWNEKIWVEIMDAFDQFDGLTDEDCEKLARIFVKKWEENVVVLFRKKLRLSRELCGQILSGH